MSSQFAIVQARLEPVDLEKMRRAFRGVPGLTPYDVNSVCSDSGGILCRNFSQEQATTLQAHLQGEGVEVEVVEESRLPSLPPVKIIHRLEIKAEALGVEDLVKGMLPVAWDQVSLLAAGSVRLTKFVRQEKVTEEMSFHHGFQAGLVPIPHTETKVEYSSKEAVDWFLRMEILVGGATMRYSIEAEHFHFKSLGEGVTGDVAGDFCFLARALAAHAPNARLSQGMTSILKETPEFVYYPRKAAFYDEITWWLWEGQRASG